MNTSPEQFSGLGNVEKNTYYSTDPVVQAHAIRLLKHNFSESPHVADILQLAFGDPYIKKEFAGAHIRYTTMCITVAKEILARLGENPERITMMAVGDVQPPLWARETILEIIQKSHQIHIDNLLRDGQGYDLTSKGAPRARTAFFSYIDRHYGISAIDGLQEQCSMNSTICSGGMRAIDDICTGLIARALEHHPNATHRFISPDNSFGTWHAIAKLRSGQERAEVHTIGTLQQEQLHLSPASVDTFYEQNTISPLHHDTWYMTPVGNPSGTAMSGEQLYTTCTQILKYQPQATIILDNTYVRTLPADVARELLGQVWQDPVVRERVICIESFSKTHGFCGERVGVYFSANPELYGSVQTVNMTLSAGNGRYKDALVEAITSASPEQESMVEQLHQFWMRERAGLYHYLQQEEFRHLFHTEQAHIQPELLEEQPMGLYLFLRLAEGVSAQQVLLTTGCGGVETSMHTGTYVRFAVGTLQEETFVKYIPNV